MNKTIEDLVLQLGSLSPAQGERRAAVSLYGDRVYLARAPLGDFEMFFRGSQSLFGALPPSRNISWGVYRVSDQNEPLPALVVKSASSDDGRRLMAHVAYEVTRVLQDEALSNQQLVGRLFPFFRLLQQNEILGPQEQIGLVGELQFLLEALSQVPDNTESQAAILASWCGPMGARRDFLRANTAFEVKASSSGVRHRVSMEQLLTADCENALFLVSLRVVRDHSANVKLPHKVDQIRGILMNERLVEEFLERLSLYSSGRGYLESERHSYLLEPGFFIEPSKLYRIDETCEILRPGSFVGGDPPAAVQEISYSIDLTSFAPLPQPAKASAICQLLAS